MSVWVLTRGLTTWRGEITTVFPKRDKESDGSIGDTAHAQGTSGHNDEDSGHAEYNDWDGLNEVRAIDVDKDLNNPKFSMEQLIQWLVTLGRAGKYLPFRYFIFNKRIWRKSTGWKTEQYNGKNPHDHHAHFSGDYTQTADNWTGTLGLAAYVKQVTGEEEAMAFIENQAQFNAAFIAALKNADVQDLLGKAAWDANLGNKAYPTRLARSVMNDLAHVRDVEVGDAIGAKAIVLPATAPLAQLSALPAYVKQAFVEESARDAQEATRDAALKNTLAQLMALTQQNNSGATVTMTAEQFQQLQTAVMQKVVEAGQDAADATNWKLNQIAAALDNAGEALSTANDEPQQK